MKKKEVDKIFLTNIPSFYKIKLYNEINKKIKILVIFLDRTDSHRDNEKRNDDFFNEKIDFEYIFLNSTNVVKQCFELKKVLKQYNYKELFISGWAYVQFWYAAFFSPKKLNSVVVESSINESVVTGLQAIIKKIFISRMSKAYVPGQSNIELMNGLHFKGQIIKTYGVGLYNHSKDRNIQIHTEIKNFIYVGRLAVVKNLEWLINQFNEMPQYNLTIVGFGPLEEQLKKIANSNIIFTGAIENKKLYEYYQKNDVFILPSKSEPWGLVVEEALDNGLPVLLSDKVGCAKEIVQEGKNGFVFELNNSYDFIQKLKLLTDIDKYSEMKKYISEINFEKIEQKQVQAYI